MSVSEALVIIANHKLAERELTHGPVDRPDIWLAAVARGIQKDHAGRIATMPAGLPLADEVKWIENGPPAQGARIPSHEWSTPPLLDAATFFAGLDAARAALKREKAAP